MPTFIDESGDTGHAQNSRPFFRLAALWIPTAHEAEELRKSIRLLRRAIGVNEDFEFKFSRTHIHPNRRRAFFKVVLSHQFKYCVCSIDKTKGPWQMASKKNSIGQPQHRFQSICGPCITQQNKNVGLDPFGTVFMSMITAIRTFFSRSELRFADYDRTCILTFRWSGILAFAILGRMKLCSLWI
jgi:hypothetical protein